MPPTTNKDKNQTNISRQSPNLTTGSRPSTRNGSRRNGESLIIEDLQDINDSTEGRKFLEKHLLLCPPGEPPTHSSLATCLHQVSAMVGIPETALNGIRSVTLLLEEMEETQINVTVKEAFDSQITKFTSDMKLLIEDVRGKIDIHLKAAEEHMVQIAEKESTQPRQAGAQPNMYATALVNPPPHANPKVAAREGIKARQFMLEGINDTKHSHLDIIQLKTELNKLLLESGLEKGRIHSINKLQNGGTLIELDSDEATAWFQLGENRLKFCQKIGPSHHTQEYTTS